MKIRKILINALITTIVFATAFFVSSTFIFKTASDSQLEIYEQVAINVYEQNNQNIIEVPDGICVEKTPTAITVTKFGNFGKVVAKIKDGKLVVTRDLETACSITLSIFIGILFSIIYLLEFGSIYYKKQEKMLRKQNSFLRN